MPCNLAVSITKGVVTQAYLLALLERNPRKVGDTFKAYFSQKVPGERVAYNIFTGGEVQMYVGKVRFSIKGGKIYVEKNGEQYLAEAEQLLQLVSDSLYTQEVQKTLAKIGTVTGVAASTVRDGKETVQATVFSMRYNATALRVFALPSGRVQIFIDSGEYEQAKAVTLALFNSLNANGVALVPTSEVESHKKSDHVHVIGQHARQ